MLLLHMLLLREERIVHRQHDRRAHSRPSRPRNRRVLEPHPEIPAQMPESIYTVEEEGHSNRKLGARLRPQRPCRDRRDERLALKVPA